jgi:hypothetical protein
MQACPKLYEIKCSMIIHKNTQHVDHHHQYILACGDSLTTCTIPKIAYMCSHQPKHGENARFSCQQHVVTKIHRDSSPVRTAHLYFGFLTNPSRKIFGRTPRFLYPRVGGREEKLSSQSYAFWMQDDGEIKEIVRG